jgi:hypothetical protein
MLPSLQIHALVATTNIIEKHMVCVLTLNISYSCKTWYRQRLNKEEQQKFTGQTIQEKEGQALHSSLAMQQTWLQTSSAMLPAVIDRSMPLTWTGANHIWSAASS